MTNLKNEPEVDWRFSNANHLRNGDSVEFEAHNIKYRGFMFFDKRFSSSSICVTQYCKDNCENKWKAINVIVEVDKNIEYKKI